MHLTKQYCNMRFCSDLIRIYFFESLIEHLPLIVKPFCALALWASPANPTSTPSDIRSLHPRKNHARICNPYIFGICAYQWGLLVSWQQTDPGLKSRQMGASCCCLGLTIHLPGPLFLLDPVPVRILLIVEPLFWLKFRMRLSSSGGIRSSSARRRRR